MNTKNMPLAPTSTLPPICDDLYTAGVESDRCPQPPKDEATQ